MWFQFGICKAVQSVVFTGTAVRRQSTTHASMSSRIAGSHRVGVKRDGARFTRTRTPAMPTNGARVEGSVREVSKPILFLDIDGVLNETATAKQIALDDEKVALLGSVIDRSGADIVLTTYWRYFEEYIGYTFERHGLRPGCVIGRTAGEPHRADSVAHDAAVSVNRIMEIEAYLRRAYGDDQGVWPSFAIVDDKEVVPGDHEWREKFIRTQHDVGLQASHADSLVGILSQSEVLTA